MVGTGMARAKGKEGRRRKITENKQIKQYKNKDQTQKLQNKQTNKPQQVARTFRLKQNKTSNKALKAVSINFSYTSITDSCEGNKIFQRFPQCLQIQFDVQPRTFSFHIMKPPVNSPGSSATYLLWCSLSEQQRGWSEWWEWSEVQRRAEGQCTGGRCPKRRWLHIWMHSVRESGS